MSGDCAGRENAGLPRSNQGLFGRSPRAGTDTDPCTQVDRRHLRRRLLHKSFFLKQLIRPWRGNGRIALIGYDPMLVMSLLAKWLLLEFWVMPTEVVVVHFRG